MINIKRVHIHKILKHVNYREDIMILRGCASQTGCDNIGHRESRICLKQKGFIYTSVANLYWLKSFQ